VFRPRFTQVCAYCGRKAEASVDRPAPGACPHCGRQMRACDRHRTDLLMLLALLVSAALFTAFLVGITFRPGAWAVTVGAGLTAVLLAAAGLAAAALHDASRLRYLCFAAYCIMALATGLAASAVRASTWKLLLGLTAIAFIAACLVSLPPIARRLAPWTLVRIRRACLTFLWGCCLILHALFGVPRNMWSPLSRLEPGLTRSALMLTLGFVVPLGAALVAHLLLAAAVRRARPWRYRDTLGRLVCPSDEGDGPGRD